MRAGVHADKSSLGNTIVPVYNALAVFLMLVVLALIAPGCSQKQTGLEVGDQLPAFSLPDLKGNKVNLPGEFRGKVVIVRFWANWCSYCASEVPAIDLVYNKYKDKGVVAVSVNVGQQREVAEAFATSQKITYPILLDAYSMSKTKYGIADLPTTFVLDRQGVIRAKIHGDTKTDSFEKLVVELL